MSKKMTIDSFARYFGSDYEGSNIYIAYQVLYYWHENGNADVHEELLQLTKEARKEILHFIICSQYVDNDRENQRLATAIIDTF